MIPVSNDEIHTRADVIVIQVHSVRLVARHLVAVFILGDRWNDTHAALGGYHLAPHTAQGFQCEVASFGCLHLNKKVLRASRR